MSHEPAAIEPGFRRPTAARPDRLTTAALLVCLGMVGCGPAARDQPAEPASAEGPRVPRGTSGLLVRGDGSGLAFQPCGAASAVSVVDATGGDLASVVEELGYGRGAIHAHVVLDNGSVRELRVAAPEAGSCEGVLPEGALQVRGNEPFWSVTIDGPTAVWRAPDELDGAGYGDGRWTAAGGAWRFEAVRDDEEGRTGLIVELSDTPCIDTMSGARYPFTASATRGGAAYDGCGLEGRGGS